ncbi:RDD family protein [Leucobacter coleopterorum]|uniref:RDD family protein n=1 Tax=Leucobacter coleopterorum TaxID=2714933 RepID=A0ABX6JW13_9MICO|nr:RDD family protein [Leucobacter coleopterorum]QIM18490.1 RDD family protein [Leucobacter coleopterorum]
MATAAPKKFGDLEPSKWPGERLGLPEEGFRSVARAGRRIFAILIDWGIALLIGNLIASGSATSWATLIVFALMQMIFIPTIGGSIGHRILGLRVAPLTGGWVGFWRPIVRTLLLVIVIPVLVWDSDQRGFHDKIAGTVLIRA